jgi:hypothetical protein
VRLPFERAVLRIRRYVRERSVRAAHPHRAFPTANDGYRSGSPDHVLNDLTAVEFNFQLSPELQRSYEPRKRALM